MLEEGCIMNKKRRKRISNVINEINLAKKHRDLLKTRLEEIKNELENILYEEEDYFDNMPENLQGSIRGEDAEEAIDYLTDAIDSLDCAIGETEDKKIDDELNDAINNLCYI